MMLGGLPPKNKEEKNNIGTTESEDIAAIKKELKWMKWAIIVLVIYIMYQQTKKS